MFNYWFLFCSGHSIAEVVRNRRRLQYHGYGASRTKSGGLVQFLCTKV